MGKDLLAHEAIEARLEEEVEQCCKDICFFCAHGYKLILHGDAADIAENIREGLYMHKVGGELQVCMADRIRMRWITRNLPKDSPPPAPVPYEDYKKLRGAALDLFRQALGFEDQSPRLAVALTKMTDVFDEQLYISRGRGD